MSKEKRGFGRFCHVVCCLFLIVASCTTPLKEVTYLNDIETGRTFENPPLPDIYRVRVNDHLYIRVITDDPEHAGFLNLIGAQTSVIGSAANIELITYLVDEEGKISYPFLGEILVENKTINEIQAILQEEVDNFLQNASVFVKLVSRSVTVLGEVRSPGKYPMEKSRMSIFETLGMAGDVTDFGNRKNVKLIRELPDGRYVGELNLTDPDIMHSPYYYILPHDVVYVEHRTKVYGAKNLAYATPLNITASVVSIALLILNLFK